MNDQATPKGIGKLKISGGLEIGHDRIDEEHRSLANELNKSIMAYHSKDFKTCYQHICEFNRLLLEHFRHEEKIMEEYKFPSINEHISAHAHLEKGMASFLEKCKDCKGREIDCIQDVIEFLLRHIAAEDTGFKGHLQELKYNL